LPAHLEKAVEPQGSGEAGDRGLTHIRQTREFAARQEADSRPALDEALGNPPLRRRQPAALQPLFQWTAGRYLRPDHFFSSMFIRSHIL